MASGCWGAPLRPPPEPALREGHAEVGKSTLRKRIKVTRWCVCVCLMQRSITHKKN